MSFGLEPRTRERVMAVALLVSVFMAGVLTALAVVEIVGRSREPEPTFAGGPPFRGPGMGVRAGRPLESGRMRPGPVGLNEMLTARLGLSEEQERQLGEILERRRVISDSILEQMRPRLEAQLDSTREEIRSVLSPEQRAEFDRYTEQGRLRIFRRLGVPGPFGGGGLPPRR